MSKNQKKKQGNQKVAYYKKDGDSHNRPITDNSRKKYEISSDSEEDAPDFNYLLKQHTSIGSHFVFKGEQEKYQGDNLDTQFSKYFNVNTDLLNLAIKSIPFNERHTIRDIEWTAEEVNQMREEARNFEQSYKELLEASLLKSEESIEKVSKKIEKLSVEPERQKEVAVLEPPQSDDKKSMEKWLDDILDL